MITNGNGMIYNPKDVYNVLKTKSANDLRYNTYFDILYNTLLDMFTYTGLPDTIPERFLESILHSRGSVFIADINGDLTACCGTLSGEVDAYGLGTDAIAVCPVGEANGKRDIDIVYGINNKTATPDLLIYWISHLLQENDNSLEHIIKYSRLLPIPKVSDEKDKQAFDEILDNLIKGELKAFASKNILAAELGEGTEVLNISDVNKVDKIQYLSRFSDDILKKFYNFYGQPINSQNKTAQSISDEIHGMDSVSFILPLQMLECRQEMCEKINRIFGTDITVDFSLTWKLEYNALVLRDTNDNGVVDTEEKTDPPTENTGTEQKSTEPLEPDKTTTEDIEPKTEQDTAQIEPNEDIKAIEQELETLSKIIGIYEEMTGIKAEDVPELKEKGDDDNV